ncbi:MAG: low molecular weight protein-tyrosine-phosphatase [Pseudomonadota bacterium]
MAEDRGQKSALRVLVVCLGNICRSPTGEAVLAAKAAARGTALSVTSAGTGGWHVGDPPDARMQRAAARRGYDLSGQRARQVDLADFYEFDWILAMDRSNEADLADLAPPNADATVRLFLSFGEHGTVDMPDPYYGGEAGFERVLDLVEAGADAFLDAVDAR